MGENTNVNLRFEATGLSKGDTVQIGVSPHGQPRAVRWTDKAGAMREHEFV